MAPKATLIFSPQKRQKKASVSVAAKLEVFLIRYCEDAPLVSESFDESQACVQIDLTHGAKPSLFFKLKENMLEFLQSDSVSDLPTSVEDLVTCRVGQLDAALRVGTSGQSLVSCGI